MNPERIQEVADEPVEPPPATCRCIDWFAEGEEKVVEVAGVRIAIEAPVGAVFESIVE